MQYIQEIKQILAQARQKTYQAINSAMVEAYWKIGEKIVLEEQNGKNRADYGKEVIKTISKELTQEYGKGFSNRTLWEIRQFYLYFQDFGIVRTLFAQLSWSHFQRVLKVPNPDARQYYLTESAQQGWSVRTLDRNISTMYYQRLLSSQAKEEVENEMLQNTKELQTTNPLDFIKNPAILEFLNLPTAYSYTEAELEKALIDNLQQFILELGKGFAFVARQEHIKTETSDFYIDLVFYNYFLKCFVIVELKTHAITHQDIGQLDMYVRMYDDLKKPKEDNPTIGILLCTETDKTVAKYSVLADNKHLYATKYIDYLPTEQELIEQIEQQKLLLKLKTNS
jgi:predicted nuclease of restriction endonuclease-like (RecB) superfamily